MADISILSRLAAGEIRPVDISANTLVTTSVKVGGSVSNTELTKAILDRLVTLQNGSDVDATYHTHDTLYYRKTALNAATNGSDGSRLIGDFNNYVNFTPTAATVKGAFLGIDAALGSISGFANTALSNLAGTTAVNSSLVAGSDVALNLGSLSFRWATLWAQTLKYSNAQGLINLSNSMLEDSSAVNALSYQTRQAFDSVPFLSIDWSARKLYWTNGSTQMLDWSQAGIIDVKTNRVANASDPVNPQDLVTLNYMNARLLGLTPKQAAYAGTTTTLPAYSYASNVITASANGALPAQDGITLTAGQRLLVKNETGGNAPYNGVYVVTATGDGTHPFVLTRSTDMNSLTPIDEFNGAWLPIQNGTTQAGQIYVEYGQVNTVGTDPVNFEFYNPIASLVGGDMITVSGSTISVDLATVSGLASTNPGNAAGQLMVNLETSNPTLQINGSNQLGVKLDAARAITTGASGIGVNVDNSTLDINSNQLEIKNLGVTLGKMAANSVDENKIVSTAFDPAGAISGGSGTKIKANVDNSSIEINSDALRIKTTAYDQATITGGGGSAAAVQYSPKVQTTVTAGQSFTGNTTYAVRWGLTANGETANRVYAADTNSSTFDLFYVIGVIQPASSLTAGQTTQLLKLGTINLASADTAFPSNSDGAPVFLGSAGAFTTTAPTPAPGTAVCRIGVVALRNASPTSCILDVAPVPVSG